MIIVGVTGKAGSGKDTVGDILRDSHGFATLAFAYPIKQMICYLVNEDTHKWSDRAWREATIPLFGKSPREMAQTIGTEWGRETVSPSIWMDVAFDRIQKEPAITNWCITDVRFNNEADNIRNYIDGHIIHVHRAETDAAPAAQRHLSEEGISPEPQDFYVNNFCSIRDLAEQVGKVTARISELQQQRQNDEAV